ncbi:MAG: PAS domain S-box protein [Candidatus Marinimicrobia bacterium]|nr:PAS domain S-box protein [Candidatus Neomarinimicrobiota bacterium]
MGSQAEDKDKKLEVINRQLRNRLEKLEKLRNEYSKYKFISNAAEDFMTLINRDYEYEAVNKSYCKEHQKEKAEILGHKVYEVWGEKAFQKNIKAFLDRCFQGKIVRYQDWFNFVNKGRGFYDVIYYPYYNQDDKITHSAVVTRNITKQKNIEIELRNSREKYRKLVEGSFDLIFTLDPQLKFQFVSSASERLFGLQADQIKNKNFEQVFFDSETHSVKEALEKLNHKKKLEAVQLILKTDDSDDAYIELNALPIIDEGEFKGYQGVVRDLTIRKKMEKKQKHLEHELIKEHRLASIGMLTSGLAHNIRSPLTVILGSIQLLEMDDQGSDKINMIKNAAKRIQNITDSMMTKLRKQQDESKQNINLNELLKNELEIMKGDLNFKHKIEKEYNFCDNMPEIRGVYNDFSQALTNIINNAVDSMYDQEEKKLRVATQVKDDHIYINIEDTGCGIEKENIPKLFDPFYTSKPKSVPEGSEEPKGTGLGLYSCYNMLKPYEAKFNVHSEVNKGTNFEVIIPVQINQE